MHPGQDTKGKSLHLNTDKVLYGIKYHSRAFLRQNCLAGRGGYADMEG
jgi:hypothetical protein